MYALDARFSPCSVAHAGSLELGCNQAVRQAPGAGGPRASWRGRRVDYPADPLLPGRAHRGLHLSSWTASFLVRPRFHSILFCESIACQRGQELPCAGCPGPARLLSEELSQQPELRPDPT